MTKDKKPKHAPKPTPVERPRSVIALPPEPEPEIIAPEPASPGAALCIICGSRMATEICPVDGWHFEAA